MAPETKKEKAFPPSSAGVALGVELDLEAWTWRIPTKKVNAIRHSLAELLAADWVEMPMIRKLVGRLNHYSTLVDGGKVERAFLTHLQNDGERAGGLRKVKVTEAAPGTRPSGGWTTARWCSMTSTPTWTRLAGRLGLQTGRAAG